MKLINLLEMPYLALHSDLEDIKPHDKSKKSAKKEYKLNNGFSIYLDTKFSFANSEILCITDDSKETKSTIHVIGEVEMAELNPSHFRFTSGGTFLNEMINTYADDIYVIEIAQINEKYMSKGIISNVYLEIAKHSIIVSDNLQYEGGKALWKKLAKIKPNNIKCLVYSEKENGRVFEDEKGQDYLTKFVHLGSESNAFTSFTKTSYLFSTTSKVPENIQLLLEMVSKASFTCP